MQYKRQQQWISTEYTINICGQTGKATKSVIFWTIDEMGKIVVVTLPNRTIPVVIGKKGQT
jgi:hypothetical protein